MSPVSNRLHSQRRIVRALQLQPMTRQDLERCLQLHRTTVTASLDALECRRKVKRTVIGSRQYGAWPELWSLTPGAALATPSPGDNR